MFKFLKNLFKKRENKYYVQELYCISSTIKNNVETIIHGNNEVEIMIKIDRQKGKANIITDKNMKLSNDDIQYLLQKYI